MKRPLLPPLLGLILGIALQPSFPGRLIFFGVVGGSSLLFFFFSVGKRKALQLLFISFFLFVAVGYLSAHFSLSGTLKTSNLLQKAGEGKNYWVGRVVSYCEADDKGARLTLEMLSLRNQEKTESLSGRLSLRIGKGECRFQIGDLVQAFTPFRKPERFKNSFSFDYPFFLLTRFVTATAYVESDEHLVKIGQERGALTEFFLNLREKAQKGLRALPDDNLRRILGALLLGDQSGLSEETEQLFRKTGTTHLLVVSGLHLVMVGGVFYFMFRLLFSLWPPLLLRISMKKWVFLAALVPITAYAALVGFSPSVLRALLTVLILGGLLFFLKERDGLSLLILVAFVLLLAWPLLVFDLSFQLSFLSVFFILILVPRWEKFFLTRFQTLSSRPWLRRILEIVLASLAVQVGLLPVLIHSFHQISLVSLPANLILVPVFTLLLMPLGLIALFFSWVVPSWAPFFFSLTAFVLKPCLAILRFLSSLPGSTPYWPGFGAIQSLLFYLFIFTALLSFPKKGKRSALLLVLALNLLAWVGPPLFSRWDDSLKIRLIDVGQGDSFLLELPHGKRILVDGGGLAYSSFDMGEKVLLPYLFGRGFWSLETVVLTHPHPDHYGGLKKVIEAFRPREFWWNGENVEDESFRGFLAEVKAQGVPLVRYDTSAPPFEIEGVRFEILNPLPGSFTESRPHSSLVNNHSLVMTLRYRGLSFFLSGDIEKESEELLLKSGKLKPSFVLKVPHHGSSSSSTEEFLRAVCPRIGLIGVGRGNRYRFPREEVLKRYEAIGTTIFRADEDGETTLRWDGETIQVSSFGGRRWARRLNSPSPESSSREGVCGESSSGF